MADPVSGEYVCEVCCATLGQEEIDFEYCGCCGIALFSDEEEDGEEENEE